MKKLASESISDALYRMVLTREMLANQSRREIAISKEGIVRREALKLKTEEVAQRLASLKIDKAKQA